MMTTSTAARATIDNVSTRRNIVARAICDSRGQRPLVVGVTIAKSHEMNRSVAASRCIGRSMTTEPETIES